MTQCNYCSHRRYMRYIKDAGSGERVVLIPNEEWGGVDMLALPKGVRKDTVAKNHKLRDKYFKSWFMELSDTCVC